MSVTPDTSLTPEMLATLAAIGAGHAPYCAPVPLAHLAVLLRLDFIRAEGHGYSPTMAGMYRIVRDD